MTEPASTPSPFSLEATLGLFVHQGDLSPDSESLFVTHAVDSERRHQVAGDKNNSSPATKTLFDRIEYVDHKVSDEDLKQKMKKAISKAFVNSYRAKPHTESSFPVGKRKLGFDNSISPATCKRAKRDHPTIVSPVEKVKKKTPLVQGKKSLKKKEKNTSIELPNIPWQKVRGDVFESHREGRKFILGLGAMKMLRTCYNTDKETKVKVKFYLFGCPGKCKARLIDTSPITVKVQLDENCSFGCKPTQKYHNRSHYSGLAAVHEQLNIEWEKIPRMEFECIQLAKDHLTATHGSLINKRTKSPSKGVIRYEYECTVEHKPGRCKARVDHAVGKPVGVRVYIDDECKCEVVPKNGLPEAVKSFLADLCKKYPTMTPKSLVSETMKEISCQFKDLINVDCDRNRLRVQNQLKRHIEYLKRQNAAEQKIKCTGELLNVHETYKFRLPQEPTLQISDEVTLNEFGVKLYDQRLLQIFGVEKIEGENRRLLASRHQTLLDGRRDPSDKSLSSAEERLYQRIEELQAKQKLEVAWEQTTVMSSLALLWNLKQCEDLNWDVSISCDGTANTVANDFKLLNLGCFTVTNMKNAPIFRPFIFILCPEEAEIYFSIGVVTLLKYARRLFGITDIKFNGLMVSDHAPAFVNVLTRAFPTSSCGSCYPHISRKLQKGKGNGAHIARLKNKDNREEALKHLKNLHECCSKEMFHKLASMIKIVWRDEMKEPELAEKFFATYIDLPHYDTWHLGMVKLPCCAPNNNANERSTLSLKGSRKEDPLCATGRDHGSMICKQFPQAIYHYSVYNVGVERCLAIDDKNSIVNSKLTRFKESLKAYCQRFDPQKDKVLSYNRSYEANGNGPVVYLVNRSAYLGEYITAKREKEHDDALAGKTSYSARDFHLYVRSANNLCKVTRITGSDGRELYRGSCPVFMKQGWCNHSAICAYESDLMRLATPIEDKKARSARTQTRQPVSDGHLGSDESKNIFRIECTAVKDKIVRALHIANETKDLEIILEVNKLLSCSMALTGYVVSFTSAPKKKKTVKGKCTLAWQASGLADNLIIHVEKLSVEAVKLHVSEIIRLTKLIIK